MSNHSPELVPTMRAALEEVMSRIPLDQAAPGIKAYMAGPLYVRDRSAEHVPMIPSMGGTVKPLRLGATAASMHLIDSAPQQ
jgi:hypothetical protein